MSWFPFLPAAASTNASDLDAVLVAVHTHVLMLAAAWAQWLEKETLIG